MSINKKVFFVSLVIISNAMSQQIAMKSSLIRNGEDIHLSKNKKNTNVNSSGGGGAEASIVVKPLNTDKLTFAPADVDINFLPLFGEFDKTKEQTINDQLFLNDCDKEFASRNAASEFFSQMGWTYLSDGEKNNAINRFNLAYLLNQNNADAYWGLGVVEYQSKKYKDAVRLISKGLDLSSNNYVMMVDLATIYIQISNEKSIEETAKARNLIEKAISIQPEYESAYMQLTLVNLLENKNDEAWESFHKGFVINPQEVNQEILTELLSRKPDPKGIFK